MSPNDVDTHCWTVTVIFKDARAFYSQHQVCYKILRSFTRSHNRNKFMDLSKPAQMHMVLKIQVTLLQSIRET